MSERRVSATRFVAAEPREVFALLQDPAKHASFDGSGMVQASRGASQLLTLGSRFGMSMKVGVPYAISSKVVEFEQDRRIAWCHLGRHRWRWELEPTDDGPSTWRVLPGRLAPTDDRGGEGSEAP